MIILENKSMKLIKTKDMKKYIFTITAILFMTTNLYSEILSTNHTKIVIVNNKIYKIKDGKLFPLLGIILKFIGPKIISSVKQKAINYAKQIFTEKSIEVLDESFANREDVEEITLNAQDSDNDGKFEFASRHEHHLNEIITDDTTLHFEEYDNVEAGVENEISNQLEFIDQYYEGDIDGDGKSD